MKPIPPRSVFDKDSKVGGQVNDAAVPPKKYEIGSLVTSLTTEAERNGVEFRLNAEVDSELISADKPDVVILATGAKPLVPPIKGLDSDKVTTAVDVLLGKASPGGKVAIIGGGMIGCETAEFLAEYGKEITIFEMLDDVATDVGVVVRPHLMNRLAELKVRLMTSCKVKDVSGDSIRYELNGEEQVENGFTDFVLAAGMVSENPLEKAVKDLGISIHVIGDAKKPAKILEALHAGLDVGRTI